MKNTTTKLYQDNQVKEAMVLLEELSERCLCPIFLLGEVATQIYANPDCFLTVHKIECGVTEGNLRPSTRSIMEMIVPDLKQENNTLHFSLNGVPVEMKIVQTPYEFLKHLDTHHYYICDFLLPNPFDTYLKTKEIV